MTSPGGVEVARVSVRIVPDTSRVARELKRDLKQIAKTVKMHIEVVLDIGSITADMKKAQQKASGKKAKLDVEVDGDGVARETRRLRQLAQKLVGAIKMTVGINIPGSLALIKTQMKILEKTVQGYNIRIPMDVVGITKWLGILGSVSALLLTIPHLIGAIGGAVNVVAGAFALLPALIAAASFGIGALVVGTQGFFSALGQAGDAKAFEEALKNLTPSAQAAARALAEFREPLSGIRKAVQEELFKGLEEPFRSLKGLLPPIKTGLTGAAGGIREMVKAWIAMATSQKSIDDAGIIAKNSNKMFENLRPALANFGQALKDIAVVGSTFLPRLGTAVSEMTGKWAKWATEARESGRLEEIIQNTIDKIKQLGRVIADVVVGFRNIFESMSGGREFLDMVETITQKFRAWSELEDTQDTLRRLGDIMREIARVAEEIFVAAFKAVGKILKDIEPFVMTFVDTFGSMLVDAIEAVTPVLRSVARWLSENKAVMVPLLITVIALVTAFKTFMTAYNAVKKLHDAIMGFKAAATVVGELGVNVVSNMKKIGTAVWQAANNVATSVAVKTAKWRQAAAEAIVNAAKASKAWIVSSSKSAAFTARYYAIMVAQAIANFAKIAAAAVVNAAKAAAAWIAQTVRMVATTIANLVVMAAAWAAHWIKMAAVALAQAARIALAWLIAMGPVGIVIALIILLVAIIVLNWDKIKEATKAVWDWIWGHIKRIGQEIADDWNALTSGIREVWDACWKFVSDIITAVGDWIGGIVEDIKGHLDSIGNVVGNVVGFFTKIKDGIVQKATDAVNWLKGLPGRILDSLGDLGNLLLDAGKAILDGFLRGLKNAWEAVKNFVSGIGSWISDHKGPISYDRKLLVPAGQAIMEGLEKGLGTGFERIQRQVSQMSVDITKPFENVGSSLASAIDSSIPGALSSADKMMTSVNGQLDAEWRAQITSEDMEPLEDRILAALASGLEVQLDGRNVTQSVNARNAANNRRK